MPSQVGPKVYLYDLPPRFQNWGHGPECWSADCVFGGPPVKVQGVEIWGSSQLLGAELRKHESNADVKSDRSVRSDARSPRS